jgi:hypothetical protein
MYGSGPLQVHPPLERLKVSGSHNEPTPLIGIRMFLHGSLSTFKMVTW